MSVVRETRPESPVKLTYDDLVLFPEDGNRHEIIDGIHYMNASPVPYHQLVVGGLYVQLFERIHSTGHGHVFPAPLDVQFTRYDIVEPDIVVVLKDNPVVEETRIIGVPDLVVEVLSPSTRGRDMSLKKNLYEQHRVPEYWIVDPADHIVHQYRINDDGKYGDPFTATESVTFRSIPDGAVIDLTRVW